MLWLKALHLIFMVAWFAGLFYLPRLFVYHALAGDDARMTGKADAYSRAGRSGQGAPPAR